MEKTIELLCIDAEPIVISSVRRVRTTTLSDHGKWTDTDFLFATSDGVELEINGAWDLFDAEEWRNEVALKMFRVIDPPLAFEWSKMVARFLVMLQSAPLEEVVTDEREKKDEQEELKKAA